MLLLKQICYSGLNELMVLSPVNLRDHSGYGLRQWEATLNCKVISHWLSPYPEWFLNLYLYVFRVLFSVSGHVELVLTSQPMRGAVTFERSSLIGWALLTWPEVLYYDGVVQDCGISSVSAMEILKSCPLSLWHVQNKPGCSICVVNPWTSGNALSAHSFESHLYLTGAIAAELWWHRSNMNVIFNC